MKRILLVKTSSLGDVIHNLPVVNDILRHFPDAHIDWIVEDSFADIPKLHPHVNQVMTVAIRRWRKQLFKLSTWHEIVNIFKLLLIRKYDAIIDTQGLIKSGIITSLTNGIKHGYDKKSIREPVASWFYEYKHQISYQQHAVNRNRALVALSLGYPIPTDAPDYGIQSSSNSGVSQINPYIIGLHGTSRDSKLWPTEYWIELGNLLAKQNLDLVLPWASETEHLRAHHIAHALKNARVLNKLTITQIANVISNAQAAVGVDTGLSHLAAALDIPTIAIYTDTNPELTGVCAGARSPAINLGNIEQTPTVTEVFNALMNINASIAKR